MKLLKAFVILLVISVICTSIILYSGPKMSVADMVSIDTVSYQEEPSPEPSPEPSGDPTEQPPPTTDPTEQPPPTTDPSVPPPTPDVTPYPTPYPSYRPYPWRVGQDVMAMWRGTWYRARIIDIRYGTYNMYKIHYHGYSSRWDEWVSADRIKRKYPPSPTYHKWRIGDKVMVLWRGSWYKARIIDIRYTMHAMYKVRYQGYSENWDEWVNPDRIKKRYHPYPSPTYYPWRIGDEVQVSWRGRWHDARIIAVGRDMYKVRYETFGSRGDEWVPPSRLRNRY